MPKKVTKVIFRRVRGRLRVFSVKKAVSDKHEKATRIIDRMHGADTNKGSYTRYNFPKSVQKKLSNVERERNRLKGLGRKLRPTHNRKAKNFSDNFASSRFSDEPISPFREKKIKLDAKLKARKHEHKVKTSKDPYYRDIRRQRKIENIASEAEKQLKKHDVNIWRRSKAKTTNTQYLDTDIGKIRISDHQKRGSHTRFNQYTGEKEFIDTSNFADLRYKKDIKKLIERLKKFKKGKS